MNIEVVSAFFASEEEKELSDEFIKIVNNYNKSLATLNLPAAIKHVYNPTVYAQYPFHMYINKYCNTKKKIMFFGMNPGPWGMSQTGVPFGEISSVRDWLGIEGPVEKPPNENEARPVTGFKCTRTEISGKRFWGLLQKLCGSPDIFFKTSFVYNYINQQWMNSKGCNLTPADFKMSEMEPLYNMGDHVLADVLRLYEVEIIVAIGRFCLTRAQKTIAQYALPNMEVVYMPHPSPRVVNNGNWEQRAIDCLRKHDLLKYYNKDFPP